MLLYIMIKVMKIATYYTIIWMMLGGTFNTTCNSWIDC